MLQLSERIRIIDACAKQFDEEKSISFAKKFRTWSHENISDALLDTARDYPNLNETKRRKYIRNLLEFSAEFRNVDIVDIRFEKRNKSSDKIYATHSGGRFIFYDILLGAPNCIFPSKIVYHENTHNYQDRNKTPLPKWMYDKCSEHYVHAYEDIQAYINNPIEQEADLVADIVTCGLFNFSKRQK